MSDLERRVGTCKRHRHTFTLLYSGFGAYPRADKAEHFHACFDEDCNRVLVGKGWDCDGLPESHRRETW